MHRAVLNQFAQPGIFPVESTHALEFIDLRGDARRSDVRRNDARSIPGGVRGM
jgi:hypothetical protein